MRLSAFMTVLLFLSFLTKNFMWQYAEKGILWKGISFFMGRKSRVSGFFQAAVQGWKDTEKSLVKFNNFAEIWLTKSVKYIILLKVRQTERGNFPIFRESLFCLLSNFTIPLINYIF